MDAVLTRILITGGARSGKSNFAQKLALQIGPPVLFVATAEAQDGEMKQRIQEHQRLRPATWRTLEVTAGIGRQIRDNAGGAGVVIVDCVTLLVSNLMGPGKTGRQIDATVEQKVRDEINDLIDCMKRLDATFIIVTNEVGMGLVPTSRVGRWYRDLLGQANQMLSGHCDQVYFMVAGLPVRIKPARG